ncbi:leucine-rich repeat domain-containing protein [bacterium 1XD42-8]|nr:leucine-rich repeat domain-containing protein [bacterium 1XD42-8]
MPEELAKRPVRKLGEGAFDAVHEVILPDSLHEIGDRAFLGSTVKKVYMGERIKKIGQAAFKDCYLLEEVAAAHSRDGLSSLPHSIEEMGESAFSFCWSLKGIELPKNLLWISEYTFFRCIQLEKVVIHEQVEEIGSSAFSDCFNHSEVEIKGEGLRRVDTSAFSKCPLLETVTLPDGAVYESRIFIYQ